MLQRKIDAKIGRKSFEEKLEELDSSFSVRYRLSACCSLSDQLTLSTKKAHEKAQGRA